VGRGHPETSGDAKKRTDAILVPRHDLYKD
jgi:hypothetical protein